MTELATAVSILAGSDEQLSNRFASDVDLTAETVEYAYTAADIEPAPEDWAAGTIESSTLHGGVYDTTALTPLTGSLASGSYTTWRRISGTVLDRIGALSVV